MSIIYGWLTWYCPYCRTENYTNKEQTPKPICKHCKRIFEWSDILED